MATYTFSPEHVGSIVDHAANLECVVESLTLANGRYTLILAHPLPEDQFLHLQDFSDIEVV